MNSALAILTLVHTALSLIGFGTGFVAFAGLLASKWPDRWTAVFLGSTVATNATGFLFPFHGFLPSHGVAAISLVVLPFAIVAIRAGELAGRWRLTYVITSMLGLYFNTFVLVVQGFPKIPALKAAAPTQVEIPFVATQGVVLALFMVATVFAAVRFRPERRESVADPSLRESGSLREGSIASR